MNLLKRFVQICLTNYLYFKKNAFKDSMVQFIQMKIVSFLKIKAQSLTKKLLLSQFLIFKTEK